MSLALAVDSRHAPRTIRPLDMWCNADEFPEPEGRDPKAADEYYELVSASFTGTVHPVVRDRAGVDHVLTASNTVTVSGSCGVTIAGDRAVCVFHPDDQLEPAIWFSLPAGSDQLTVDVDGDTLHIRHRDFSISSPFALLHFRNTGKYATSQQKAAAKALSHRAAAADIEVRTEDPNSAVTGRWIFDAEAGCYLEHLGGDRTGGASITDPTASRRVRLDQLQQATWLPEGALSKEFERVIGGQAGLGSPGNGRGLVGCPVPLASLATRMPAAEPQSTGVMASYLWPGLDRDGSPLLEADERIVHQWRSDAPRGGYAPKNEDPLRPSATARMRRIFSGEDGVSIWTLTDRRLIVVCEPTKPAVDPSFGIAREDLSALGLIAPNLDVVWAAVKARRRQRAARIASEQVTQEIDDADPDWWAMHIRVEWVRQLYCEDYAYPAKKALFGAGTPARTSHSTTVGFGDDSRVLDIDLRSGSGDEADASLREQVVQWLRDASLSLGETMHRTSDNGSKGTLSVTYTPVDGRGVYLPLP